MNYPPKILYNPKSEVVTFMCDHQSYVFQPGEKKNLEGFAAHHALKVANTGLQEYVVDEEGNLPYIASSDVAYDKMPWRELVSMGSARDLFKPGMGREELTKLLIDLDDQEAGAV
jgi:hypothetical protein